LEQEDRRKIIERALATFGVEDRDGVLLFSVKRDAFGDALFSYVQALLRIVDVAYLNREIGRSTFIDDLYSVVETAVPEGRRQIKWHDPASDSDDKYPVDVRVDGNETPLFLFGVPTDEKCNVATIVIQNYRMAKAQFKSLAVFKDQESIGRKPLAGLTDVVDKQFSSLNSNREQVAAYLTEWASHSHDQ
jgi:hypothetical protein